ncbi:hypothetical protein V8G54_037641 [Vigna mungo]|uniref:Uncharacterized protein n=1 Tax=Vigna mungo TaxID=3915 RepID=A0AAQ3RGP4_VIGMU
MEIGLWGQREAGLRDQVKLGLGVSVEIGLGGQVKQGIGASVEIGLRGQRETGLRGQKLGLWVRRAGLRGQRETGLRGQVKLGLGASAETGLGGQVSWALWVSVETGLWGQSSWALWVSVETGLWETGLGGQVKLGFVGQCRNWALEASVETGLLGQCGNWAYRPSELGLPPATASSPSLSLLLLLALETAVNDAATITFLRCQSLVGATALRRDTVTKPPRGMEQVLSKKLCAGWYGDQFQKDVHFLNLIHSAEPSWTQTSVFFHHVRLLQAADQALDSATQEVIMSLHVLINLFELSCKAYQLLLHGRILFNVGSFLTEA